MNRKYMQTILCCGLAAFSTASLAIDSVGVGVGFGKPSNLLGGRVAVQWDWEKALFSSRGWDLTGYWDLSAAYWHTDGDPDHHGAHKALGVLAFAPVFRLIPHAPFANTLQPYLEASVGASVLTANHLAQRDLGSIFNFQDLLGFGVLFGSQQQYDLSYHFLHYSNAGFAPPNQGIDVKAFVSFKWHVL